FSKKRGEEAGSNLCKILGLRKVQCLGKYLGIPLFHERVTNNFLRFVVDKDNWIPELGTLVNQIPIQVNLNMGCQLKDMVIEEGRMNLDLLKVWLLGAVVKCIQRLLTLVEWVRRGIGEDERCLLCGHTLEDVLYAIGDCSTSKWIHGKLLRKGVLRDHHGKWIIGFNRRLALCFVLNVELWGILDGLTVLNIKNWDKVSIRTDRVEVTI
ncbi:hypothetical protein Gorai_014229, partial [Gossypium raimondii]|nr:hypothetical protein [Gossypium raimondii]